MINEGVDDDTAQDIRAAVNALKRSLTGGYYEFFANQDLVT